MPSGPRCGSPGTILWLARIHVLSFDRAAVLSNLLVDALVSFQAVGSYSARISRTDICFQVNCLTLNRTSGCRAASSRDEKLMRVGGPNGYVLSS